MKTERELPAIAARVRFLRDTCIVKPVSLKGREAIVKRHYPGYQSRGRRVPSSFAVEFDVPTGYTDDAHDEQSYKLCLHCGANDWELFE